MYNSQVGNSTKNNHFCEGNCTHKKVTLARPLGTFTKTHSNLTSTSFSRPHDFILQDRSSQLLPKERVSNCLKKRITKDRDREVAFNTNSGTCHWANVQRCGSVWSCPPCAKRITEARRKEIKKACDSWKLQGGYLMLLTLTNSHSASSNPKELKKGQLKALNSFFGDRKGCQLFSLMGKQHHIRSFEVTYGENGFHPHFHILLFLNKDLKDYDNIKHKLSLHWINSCSKAGLPLPDMKHGLDLSDGSFADKYVAKWGIPEEMTKGHVKRGYGSYTPFDLLSLSIEDKPIFGDKLPSKLFQQFALTFKGSRQLCWSKGLKKLLGINEKTDEQLADETDNMSVVVNSVSDARFFLLTKYQERHLYLDWVLSDLSTGLLDDVKGMVSQNINRLIQLENST